MKFIHLTYDILNNCIELFRQWFLFTFLSSLLRYRLIDLFRRDIFTFYSLTPRSTLTISSLTFVESINDPIPHPRRKTINVPVEQKQTLIIPEFHENRLQPQRPQDTLPSICCPPIL